MTGNDIIMNITLTLDDSMESETMESETIQIRLHRNDRGDPTGVDLETPADWDESYTEDVIRVISSTLNVLHEKYT